MFHRILFYSSCALILSSCQTTFTSNVWEAGVRYDGYSIPASEGKNVFQLGEDFYVRAFQENYSKSSSLFRGVNSQTPFYHYSRESAPEGGREVYCLLDVEDKAKEIKKTGELHFVKILGVIEENAFNKKKAKPVARVVLEDDPVVDGFYVFPGESVRTWPRYATFPLLFPSAGLDLTTFIISAVFNTSDNSYSGDYYDDDSDWYDTSYSSTIYVDSGSGSRGKHVHGQAQHQGDRGPKPKGDHDRDHPRDRDHDKGKGNHGGGHDRGDRPDRGSDHRDHGGGKPDRGNDSGNRPERPSRDNSSSGSDSGSSKPPSSESRPHPFSVPRDVPKPDSIPSFKPKGKS